MNTEGTAALAADENMEKTHGIDKGEGNLVKVKTKPYGDIEVSERQVIDFPEGILGFDSIEKFVLLEEEGSPFFWLQAFNEPELAFVIIQPVDFMGAYDLVISQSDLETVGAGKPDELLVFSIVTIPVQNPADMTANLQGPIIINAEKRLGKQAISLSDNYRVKHKILEEMKKAGKGSGGR
jgi:flagellar assembly factor FliW